MAILISVALLFVGIGILVTIHTCIVGRAFRRGFFTNSNTNNTAEESNSSRSMSRDEIEKLPQFDFRDREKGNSSPVDCPVCLDTFKSGDKCRYLPPCSHSFHAECIDLWLLKAPVCPICRSNAAGVVSIGPLISSSGEESSRQYNSESITESRHIQSTLHNPETEDGTFVAVAVTINEDRPATLPRAQ